MWLLKKTMLKGLTYGQAVGHNISGCCYCFCCSCCCFVNFSLVKYLYVPIAVFRYGNHTMGKCAGLSIRGKDFSANEESVSVVMRNLVRYWLVALSPVKLTRNSSVTSQYLRRFLMSIKAPIPHLRPFRRPLRCLSIRAIFFYLYYRYTILYKL